MRTNFTNKNTKQIQHFYQTNPELITSPFISQFGIVDVKLFEQVLNELSLNVNNNPILDLGCGTGLLSTYFTKQGLHYVGADLNAHENFSVFKSDYAHFIQCNALNLPFHNRSIGMILCMDSFEHYPNQYQATLEMKRVLKYEGSIFLSVPNYYNVAGLVKKYMEKSGRYKPESWAPFHFWKQQELEKFMTPMHVRDTFLRAGFTSFKMIGLARELCFGILPWLSHPKCPGKIIAIITLFFRLFERPVVRYFPWLSLHTLWHIC